MASYSLTLFAYEHGRTSKVGEFNDSIVLDSPMRTYIGPLLQILAEGREEQELLFQFTYGEWKAAAKSAAIRAGLGPLQPVLYQLRHLGPSSDAAEGRRSLAQIKARGRWASEPSVRRYEKHAQLARQCQKLSPAAQALATECLSHIGWILAAAAAPLLPCDAAGCVVTPSPAAFRVSQRKRVSSSSKLSHARDSVRPSLRWA